MLLAFYGRITRTTDFQALERFLAHLRAEGTPFVLYAPYAERLAEQAQFADSLDLLSERFTSPHELEDADFLFTIGGDGTLLDAGHLLENHSIPIVAVNAGRLGFLASVGQTELFSAYEQLLHNNWRIDNRAMLEVTSRPFQVFADWPCALNEVTIHKANSNEMLMVHTYVNGEFLNSYWSDGLILSTPTGSTAYSLACGGPIMMPDSATFVLTPIAPHSLTVRPLILPDNAVVSFEIEARSGQAMIALDNRTELVPQQLELAIQRHSKSLQLVKFPDKTFFQTLRQRLSWGVDTRRYYS
jgi:NAD+ kinase